MWARILSPVRPRGPNRPVDLQQSHKNIAKAARYSTPPQRQFHDMIEVENQPAGTMVPDVDAESTPDNPPPQLAVSSDQTSSVGLFNDPHAATDDMDLYFDNSFPDEDILGQYMDLADIGDPFNFNIGASHSIQDISLNNGSSVSETTSPAADATCYFRSPLPWVRDWMVSRAHDDGQNTKWLKESAFILPSSDEIRTAIMLYFTHVQPRLPVLSEREFHGLLTEVQSKPISLALLYAILFVATPNRYYENERYVVKAYELLVENNALQQDSHPRSPDPLSWKRATTCFMSRAACLLIALKKTSKPDMFVSFSSFRLHVSLEDFKEDYQFSWYLSAEAKKNTYQLFVALFQLQMRVVPLGKLLVNRMALDAANQSHSQASPYAGEHLSIDEIELKIDEWKQDNGALLDAEPPESFLSTDLKAFKIAQAYTRLSYEYVPPF
ncbi:hypothetical protein H2200_012291 [Cladophialophora chaetospira]|uniref:Transcription factor domain-containing protein n=1 Tax=Cladophialophora chaetospira TaxID=386627 RepID=A0AA38WXI8_9EURO|nr:hypothetical protein H2200_012291 [Cladophialophora chaetospira]